jgi:hypothetical protein
MDFGFVKKGPIWIFSIVCFTTSLFSNLSVMEFMPNVIESYESILILLKILCILYVLKYLRILKGFLETER